MSTEVDLSIFWDVIYDNQVETWEEEEQTIQIWLRNIWKGAKPYYLLKCKLNHNEYPTNTPEWLKWKKKASVGKDIDQP